MAPLHPEFAPTLLHPYYFIRQGLKDHISTYAPQLSGRLMDFGCGSKPYRSLFNVTEYIGVDFENEGHPHDNEVIDVYYDGKKLPFEAAAFDSILCSEVFEHVFNLEEILKELNRVLKMDGKMLVTCPFVWNEHEVPHDYARYTRFALDSLLRKAGFEIVAYSKSGNFITTLFQLNALYFFNAFKGAWRKVFLFRWFYKFAFFFLPNVIGVVCNKILPRNESLYLNNVLVARKIANAG